MTQLITSAATVAAAVSAAEVQAAANLLADAMCKIHGGKWRIQIEHEHAFVTVAQISDRRPMKPKGGVV